MTSVEIFANILKGRKMTNKIANSAILWLKESVFPLWKTVGIDSRTGAFVESISFDKVASTSARRALVQARQIYSFAEASKLEILGANSVKNSVELAVANLVQCYATDSGAYIHSVDINGQPQSKDVDLYTQAFVLFGLAQAFDLLRKSEIKQEALKVLNYLLVQRRAAAGGFTEVKNAETFYQSNPHMHLFEAALAWTKIDDDPRWHALTLELYALCNKKFIDTETGFLAEHFDVNWQPLREDGNFIFEPGHHYEWAWLMLQYQEITGFDIGDRAQKLFQLAEKYGVSEDGSLAYDEVWSNGQAKKTSSRFWPQCERIKAAAVLNRPEIADLAMQSLFQNFLTEQGLWHDAKLSDGHMLTPPAKGSSLYHIINAISEYAKFFN